MDKKLLDIICEPVTGENLWVDENVLKNEQGKEYEIINGIPNLVDMLDKEKNTYAMNLFKEKAEVYDNYQHLSFETFYLDENQVRNSLIEKLNIDNQPKRVLEVNAGTGRDSVLIRKRLGKAGELHVQDISMDMLNVLQKKFNDEEVYITQSNASALPYKDKSFDAIYSFGGVGMGIYSDLKVQLREIVRVSKIGAKVVLGGLGMGLWLRESEFGKILLNHNKHYENVFDISAIPIEARNVTLSWILNGAGFCVEFEVGEGEPEADFDFDIPGVRGGTLRTRYYGKLEGVSPKAKELAMEARQKMDVSMYDFLNLAIEEKARKILEG